MFSMSYVEKTVHKMLMSATYHQFHVDSIGEDQHVAAVVQLQAVS